MPAVTSDEKVVWTSADFDHMSWHDAALHAVAVEPAPPHPGRLLLDLDYIVEWVAPSAPRNSYAFQLCPTTLVFDDAADLVLNLDLGGRSFGASVDGIVRSEPNEHGIRDWNIEGHEFTISLRAKGFTQYLRQRPIQASSQRLGVQERGGIRFDERGFASVSGSTP
jgi:hypothetical protein